MPVISVSPVLTLKLRTSNIRLMGLGKPAGGYGNFFEDFHVGQEFQHSLGRTILEADNTWFTLLTMNTHPAHFDAHYASRTEFGKILVNSGLTVAIILGISVADVSQNAIANLGWSDIKLSHPVFIGDTLYAESRVTPVRPSKSRPNTGIVSVHTSGINQDGDVCVSWERTAMIAGRNSEQAAWEHPRPKVATSDQ